ncbi:LysR family transcriptional regulator [Aureibacillus halotolerans]|uniref:DNA-binding transcriptional LysR family regulator n=1 Tax=Aureibacillus halotolerans TaxID=1508390 RepID=A0A4R6U4Q9_9BACI|nr:LysR family transcriptional regulator [Aureibacillus halotolerans]TDQ41151.1 DNA-binding transcriptional LysR family regulator [Aureibacillus halotolerans]
MELRQLLTFKTIVDTGSFSAAAEELGYAQSSITAHMKALEKELGQPLLDRLGKTVQLTQTGRRFLPYVEEMLSLHDTALEAVTQNDTPSGPLTIGATESMMVYWLPGFINHFKKMHPAVELQVVPVDYLTVATQLQQNEMDIAMLLEKPSWKPPNVTALPFQEERLSIVQSAQHFPVETMLFTEKACSWRPIFEEYLHQHGQGIFQKLELPSVEAIKQCVLCGLGISMLPNFVVEEQIKKGELVATAWDTTHHSLQMFAAVHQNKWHSANMTAWLDTIQLFTKE